MVFLFYGEHFGMSLSGLLTFGGIGGIAIGMAGKDILSNLFSGIMLYFDRPFKIGDWVSSPDRHPIHFNFNGLELDEKYVLPLTIEEDPSYVQNKYKGRYKALLGVNLFNDYSGTYNTTLMNIYIEGTTTDPAKVDTRLARVVDENTIFFYAGSTWVEDENRSRYKVFVEFEEGTEDEEGTIKGKLRLYGDEGEPGINIRPLGECKYEKRIIQHETIKYMERHLTTLELSYKYTDVTSNPDYPITYEVKGSMTMERQINPLIPDEDQAIEW